MYRGKFLQALFNDDDVDDDDDDNFSFSSFFQWECMWAFILFFLKNCQQIVKKLWILKSGLCPGK